MPEAPRAEDELQRLQALERLCVLDTPPEAVFDSLVRVAARHYRTPVALLTLVDEHRQWFKAALGWDRPETPRRESFCAYTILGDEPLVVPDARADPRFQDNPLVAGDPGIRFYAGAPLLTSDGYKLGSLCVIDTAPRSPAEEIRTEVLEELALVAVEQLELQLQSVQSSEAARESGGLVAVAQEALLVYGAAGGVRRANAAAAELFGVDGATLLQQDAVAHAGRMLDADGLPLPPEDFPALAGLRQNAVVGPVILGLSRGGRPPLWVRVQARPIAAGGSGRTGGASAVAVSLTPLSDPFAP